LATTKIENAETDLPKRWLFKTWLCKPKLLTNEIKPILETRLTYFV